MKKFSEWMNENNLLKTVGTMMAGPVGYHVANAIGGDQPKAPVIGANADQIKSDFALAKARSDEMDLLRKQIQKELEAEGYTGIDLINRIEERLQERMNPKKPKGFWSVFRK